MLFILAIDPLQRILSKATLHGILSPHSLVDYLMPYLALRR
jgi:hypothetical protein